MIGATAFPSICGVLFSSPTARGYRSCVIHGDLNSDNVVVGPNGAPVQLIDFPRTGRGHRSEEHTSELQSLMRISYAVFCLKKKKYIHKQPHLRSTAQHPHNIST